MSHVQEWKITLRVETHKGKMTFDKTQGFLNHSRN